MLGTRYACYGPQCHKCPWFPIPPEKVNVKVTDDKGKVVHVHKVELHYAGCKDDRIMKSVKKVLNNRKIQRKEVNKNVPRNRRNG